MNTIIGAIRVLLFVYFLFTVFDLLKTNRARATELQTKQIIVIGLVYKGCPRKKTIGGGRGKNSGRGSVENLQLFFEGVVQVY